MSSEHSHTRQLKMYNNYKFVPAVIFKPQSHTHTIPLCNSMIQWISNTLKLSVFIMAFMGADFTAITY